MSEFLKNEKDKTTREELGNEEKKKVRSNMKM